MFLSFPRKRESSLRIIAAPVAIMRRGSKI
jgi:hypothetical protein